MRPNDYRVAQHDSSVCDEACRHAGRGLSSHDRADGPREEGANLWKL
jgi:hypothetical protein